jgi:hypothetical protein
MVEASPVLDYAPPPPASTRWRAVRRVLATAVIVVLAAVLGVTIGYELTPSVQHAKAYYNVNLPPVRPVTPKELASSLDAHVIALRSPASYDAILAAVQSWGVSVPSGEAGRKLLERDLKIDRIPNSTVMSVSFASRDAALANGVVSAAVRQGAHQTVFGVPPASLGTSSGPRRSPWGAIAGGLVAGFAALLFLRRLHAPARPSVTHDRLDGTDNYASS